MNVKKLSLLFSLVFFFPITALAASNGELVVLHTNDFHGHPLKFYHYPAPDVGGLPAIATFVQQMRERHSNILALDAGDLNNGRPESTLFKCAPDIIGCSYIGYDAMVLGNHEFDNPLSVLKKQQQLAGFPFISANIKTKSGNLLVSPYIIKTFEDIKVGVFGLTSKNTEVVGNPKYVSDLVFEDEVLAARKMVADLKYRVDILIALVHLGLDDDETKGSRRLAAEVPGIDLIIDGHSHTDLDAPVFINGTPIVQAWQWGMKVGVAEFTLQNGHITGFKWHAEPINLKRRIKKPDGSQAYEFIGTEYKEDPYLLSILKPYGDQVEMKLAEVIGEAKESFYNKMVREQETPLGDLVADAMRWYTRTLNTDFAIQNGGGIRAELPKGKIPKKLIYEILPFDNTVMVLKLKGNQVKELFDYIATIPPGMGAFAQVSRGVAYTLNRTSKTCESLTIDGQPIDLKKTYTIATNSYMAEGGDGYKVFKKALEVYDTSVFQRDAVIEYIIHTGGVVTPKTGNRIKIIAINHLEILPMKKAA